jgi:DNA-binding HxlR family transcriptional regulator
MTETKAMPVMKRLPGLPIERALGVISGRWKAFIIYILLDGPKRICELENQISGISQKVLIQQLKALEEHGLIRRQASGNETQRVDYVLTPLGMSLKPIIAQLYDWGRHHAAELQETDNLLPCSLVRWMQEPPEPGTFKQEKPADRLSEPLDSLPAREPESRR